LAETGKAGSPPHPMIFEGVRSVSALSIFETPVHVLEPLPHPDLLYLIIISAVGSPYRSMLPKLLHKFNDSRLRDLYSLLHSHCVGGCVHLIAGICRCRGAALMEPGVAAPQIQMVEHFASALPQFPTAPSGNTDS